jgi:hypothetical protein
MQIAVDPCAVTPWGNWSQCSVTCDWGFRHRERHFVDPQADRKKCIRISLSEVEKCHGQSNALYLTSIGNL